MSRSSSPAPGMSSGTAMTSRTDRFQPWSQTSSTASAAASGIVRNSLAHVCCGPAPPSALACRAVTARCRGPRERDVAGALQDVQRLAGQVPGGLRLRLPVLLPQPGPGKLTGPPAEQLFPACPDPDERRAERAGRSGLDLAELLAGVGGLAGGGACRDAPGGGRDGGGGDARHLRQPLADGQLAGPPVDRAGAGQPPLRPHRRGDLLRVPAAGRRGRRPSAGTRGSPCTR